MSNNFIRGTKEYYAPLIKNSATFLETINKMTTEEKKMIIYNSVSQLKKKKILSEYYSFKELYSITVFLIKIKNL